jgi:hypothetical protein
VIPSSNGGGDNYFSFGFPVTSRREKVSGRLAQSASSAFGQLSCFNTCYLLAPSPLRVRFMPRLLQA